MENVNLLSLIFEVVDLKDGCKLWFQLLPLFFGFGTFSACCTKCVIIYISATVRP